MKSKRIIAAILAGAMAVSFASCGSGNSGESDSKTTEAKTTTEKAEELDPEEKKLNEAAEKLDEMTEDMTDEELEKALEKGGLDLGEDEPKETEPEKPAAPAGYQPTEEILNADFTSGLIQVGNDVFRCGGYITLRDFVEKYGDRWKCVDGDKPNDKFDLDAPITDLQYTGLKDMGDTGGYYEFENNGLRISVHILNKYKDLTKRDFDELYQKAVEVLSLGNTDDTNLMIEMEFADIETVKSSPMNKYWVAENWAGYRAPDVGKTYEEYKYSEKTTIGDLIVMDVSPNYTPDFQNTFYPSGLDMVSDAEYSEENAKSFFTSYLKSSGEIFDLDTIPDNTSGGKNPSTGKNDFRSARRGSYNTSMIHMENLADGKIIKADENKSVDNTDVYYKSVKLKETNLLGYTPTISVVYFNSGTGSAIYYSEFEFDKNSIYIPNSDLMV